MGVDAINLQKLLNHIYKYRLSSVLTKLLISYASILLVVLLFNTSIYFYLKYSLIEKEVSNAGNYLAYSSEIIDTELMYLKNYIHRFLEDSQYTQKMKNMEDINNQVSLMKDLRYLITTFPFVEMAVIYNPDNEMIITNEGTGNKEMVFNEIYKNSAISVADILTEIESTKEFGYISTQPITLGLTGEVKDMLTFYSGVSYSSNNYRLVLFVDISFVEKSLRTKNISNYGDTYIINSNNDTLVGLGSGALDIGKIKYLKNNKAKYNNNSLVFYSSSFKDWQYVTVLNDKAILGELGFIRNAFIIIISLMMIICIIITVNFSKSYYKPIAGIIDRYMLKMGKNKSEFDTIGDVLDDMHVKTKKYDENKVLSGIIKSSYYSEELDSIFKYAMFQVVVINASGKGTVENIENFITLDRTKYVYKVLHDDTGGSCIIVNSDNISEEELLSCLSSAQKKYFEQHGVYLVFGIGNICEQLIDIHKSYDRAVNAITNGNSCNKSNIYFYKKDTGLNYSIYIPIDFESKITECIYTHNHQLIDAMIDDVFEKNSGIPNIYMRSVVTTLISVYTKLCRKIGLEPQYDESINDEFRVDVIISCIKQLYQSVEADVVREDKADVVGDFVMNYIKENYGNPAISIENIADEMNLSSSYISTLFKKATGIAFSQYLLQYRIDKAKEMLESTDKKIKEISEKSGFGTYNNFVRMFRRKTGIAPSEYRNKL